MGRRLRRLRTWRSRPRRSPCPPGRGPQRGSGEPRPPGKLDATTVVTAGSSLAVVLGLFLVVAWVLRRTTPGNCPVLSREVFEVLGGAPLAARQQAHLVRLGTKLVLLSVLPTGVETLSEVTEPDEVNRLAGLCQRSRPDIATAAFRQVFQRFNKDRGGDRPIEPGASDRGARWVIRDSSLQSRPSSPRPRLAPPRPDRFAKGVPSRPPGCLPATAAPVAANESSSLAGGGESSASSRACCRWSGTSAAGRRPGPAPAASVASRSSSC